MLINLSFSNIVVRTMSVRVARTLVRCGRITVPVRISKEVLFQKLTFVKIREILIRGFNYCYFLMVLILIDLEIHRGTLKLKETIAHTKPSAICWAALFGDSYAEIFAKLSSC